MGNHPKKNYLVLVFSVLALAASFLALRRCLRIAFLLDLFIIVYITPILLFLPLRQYVIVSVCHCEEHIRFAQCKLSDVAIWVGKEYSPSPGLLRPRAELGLKPSASFDKRSTKLTPKAQDERNALAMTK